MTPAFLAEAGKRMNSRLNGPGGVRLLEGERSARWNPAQQRYNPAQPRRPDGKWGSGGFAGITAPADWGGWGYSPQAEATFAASAATTAALTQAAGERAELRAEADQWAAETYQSTRWVEINDPLRYKVPLPDEYEGGLGLRQGHSPAADVARLDRLMTSEGGMPIDADLYRGMSANHLPDTDSAVGLTFRDHGFVSTSPDFDTAETFAVGHAPAVVAKVRVPKGSPALVVDNEVVLPRDLTFKITRDRSIQAAVPMRYLDVEIVP